MFTEAFLETLPADPLAAGLALCDEFIRIHQSIPPDEEVEAYDQYLEAHAALEAFIHTFDLEFSIPILGPNERDNIQNLAGLVFEMQTSLKQSIAKEKHLSASSRFRARFEAGFIYEFSDGDLTRIQQLLNELRDEIIRSELFDAKHKQRVLNKVESLQREIHKKITSLDKLWGLIGEAGVALGKFGSDAKPFVDRIKEIAQITWRTQARAEELPSGTTLPLLTTRSDADEDDDA